MRKRYSILIIVIILYSSIYSYSYFEYKKCLRFSESKLIIPLSFYSETNLTYDQWVSVSFDISSWFIANAQLAISSGMEAGFDNIGPIEGFDDENQGQRIYWPEDGGHIICQWDIENYQEIHEDIKVHGRLLRTLNNYFDENGQESPFDVTYYCFTPNESAYCFEFDEGDDVNIAIHTSSNIFDETNYNVPIKVCKNTNDNDTNIKRAYKVDFTPSINYYIKIYGNYNYDYYSENHSYAFTVKKVKPIILVHGIGASPVSTNDFDTTFGKIPEEFPIISELSPKIIFDFPWNAKSGSYTKYCGDDSTSLFHFVEQKCNYITKKPIMFVHSMGGLLTLRQMENKHAFLTKMDSFAFFGTPFCGSDAAQHDIIGKLFASEENLRLLRRGTNHIWDLLDNIPDAFFRNHNSLYFIGTDPWILYLIIYYGGTSCDGVVKEASADLPGTLLIKNFDVNHVDLNHIKIKKLILPYKNDYKNIYDKIKEKLF